MRRSILALAVVAILAVIGFGLAQQPAHAVGERVICTQVPQKPGQLDEQFVANFLNEQLVNGRKYFVTVNGVSTVLCAH